MNLRPTIFPLTQDPQNSTSQTTATQLTARYKNMLGSQAASFDVGLFYQLERSAEEAAAMEKTGNSSTVNQYGSNGRPIEAGGVYA